MMEINLISYCAPVDQLEENCADKTNVMGFYEIHILIKNASHTVSCLGLKRVP